ncbi:hypothetical protein LTR49_023820 [Elasticomyces elasticus]|nr:hypothetical protein LTR49_023820 [Elasticomyces elasticus]
MHSRLRLHDDQGSAQWYTKVNSSTGSVTDTCQTRIQRLILRRPIWLEELSSSLERPKVSERQWLSFARAGASQIAIGARSSLTSVAASLKKAAVKAGRSEPQVFTLELDVTSQSSIEAAASQVSSAFGKLDVLIHNLGVLEDVKPITDTDPDEWWRTWEVNVRGPYLISRSFIPLLLKDETKTLVVVSNVGAHVVLPGLSAYQPSKLATTRFMEFAATEYQDQGLVAISVHPGNIMTDMAGTFETGRQTSGHIH